MGQPLPTSAPVPGCMVKLMTPETAAGTSPNLHAEREVGTPYTPQQPFAKATDGDGLRA